jgi:hypothetical protein
MEKFIIVKNKIKKTAKSHKKREMNVRLNALPTLGQS